jgi:hypothetical protein
MYKNPCCETCLCDFFNEIWFCERFDAAKATFRLEISYFLDSFLSGLDEYSKGGGTCKILGIHRLRHLRVRLVRLD